MFKVVFVGYMGSGKSVISRKLSNRINVDAVDLDEFIEARTKMSITKIFELKGHIFFRNYENKVFKELITSEKELIISTGGGSPCYFNNHKLLNENLVISIYLKASVNTLMKRLKNNANSRPLLSNLKSDDTEEFIAKHLFERSFFYNQAKYIVNVDDKTEDEIVDEIILLLK